MRRALFARARGAPLAAGLAFLVGACDRQPEPMPGGNAPAAGPPYNDSTMPPPDAPRAAGRQVQLPPRPGTLEDTILVEGTPEPVRLALFDGSELTPGFTTYVPEGLAPELRRADAGTGIDFTARFGGDREPRARFAFFAYDASLSRAQVNERLLTFASGRQPREEPEVTDRFPWSLLELQYEYTGDDGEPITGTVALGRRAGRYFHILIQYPLEYADGMAPRIDRIIRHWRWEDDGYGLIPR